LDERTTERRTASSGERQTVADRRSYPSSIASVPIRVAYWPLCSVRYIASLNGLVMHRSPTVIRLLAVTLALVSATVRRSPAQTIDAAILGSVRDSAGAGLAGVIVTAQNGATGVRWTVNTTETGRFAFLQLPLGGPYTITARRIGFRSAARSGYELTLGSRVLVDIVLGHVATSLDPVIIAGTSQERRAPSMGANFRVSSDQLASVPAVNRNFTDLATLAPTTGTQASLLGQRWTSTDIRVDGAQAKNLLRAGEFGAGPFTLSMEAIREFEVTNAVYDVTQGRQGGGTVRAATKAGTNEFTGSAFAYYRGSDLTPATDFQARTRAQRQFDAVQWGGSVGGPIVRDRAHFFVALDQWDSNEPLFSGLIQTPGDEIGAGVARDSLSRLIRILAAKYALDTTRSQLGRLDRRPVASTAFARLDWAIDERHSLTISNDFSLWDSPLSGGVDQPITLYDGRSNYHTLENLSLASLHSTLASGLQNELQFGVSSSNRRLTPNSTAPRGFVRIQSTLSDGSHGDTKIQFGGNRLAPDDSRETELQLIDHAYLQRGNVLWTLGTDNTLGRMTTYIAESQSGLFEFNSLADLDALRPFRYSRSLPLEESQPTTHQSIAELSTFAQAEWRPHPRLNAMLGLRWDGTAFLTAPARNALVEQVLGERTDRRPSDWTKFQPRAQLVWDVGGNGRDVVRAGAGRFMAQAPYYVQHNQLLNDGSRIADITLTTNIPVPDYASYRSSAAANPGLPAGASPPAPYVNLVDPGFRTPSVWKASTSYRRLLGDRLTLTGTWLYTRTTDDYMYQDRNLRSTPAFRLTNEENRAVFVPAATIDAQGRTLNANALASPSLGRVLELTNTGEGRTHTAIAEAAAELPRRISINASYTYNQAFDNTTFGCCLARTSTTFTAIKSDPRDLSGSWGLSDTDFRHKVVVAGSVPLGWGVLLGGRYVGQSGLPFSAVVNGDINGDEATSNDLAFVFDPNDPSTPASIAASMRKVLDNPRNVARDYLRASLGHIASRNGAFAPWTERIDARFAKTIRAPRGQSAAIALDVFNVANLVNHNWGAAYLLPVGISNQNPVVQRIPLLNVVGFNQTTKQYVYTVNENFGVLQKGGNPYQVQLSLRYGF
jgi:hypothetical protein